MNRLLAGLVRRPHRGSDPAQRRRAGVVKGRGCQVEALGIRLLHQRCQHHQLVHRVDAFDRRAHFEVVGRKRGQIMVEDLVLRHLPKQRRHRFKRVAVREQDRIVTAKVELALRRQGDARVLSEDDLLLAALLLAPLFESQDVAAPVAAYPHAGHLVGAHEAPAHVGVERGDVDAQRLGRLVGAEVKVLGHGFSPDNAFMWMMFCPCSP